MQSIALKRTIIRNGCRRTRAIISARTRCARPPSYASSILPSTVRRCRVLSRLRRIQVPQPLPVHLTSARSWFKLSILKRLQNTLIVIRAHAHQREAPLRLPRRKLRLIASRGKRHGPKLVGQSVENRLHWHLIRRGDECGGGGHREVGAFKLNLS